MERAVDIRQKTITAGEYRDFLCEIQPLIRQKARIVAALPLKQIAVRNDEEKRFDVTLTAEWTPQAKECCDKIDELINIVAERYKGGHHG